jgi:Retrotransposon gag protein.
MAETMTTALKRFADGEQNRRRWRGTSRSLPYKFAGQDHEDPEWFLERLGEYFTDTETYDDSERIEVFREQLQGEARRWFDNSIYLVYRYRELETLFLERYNSPEQIAHLLAKLYGEKQPATESAPIFLTRKRRMCDRLIPDTPFSITSTILLDQLEPNLRSV